MQQQAIEVGEVSLIAYTAQTLTKNDTASDAMEKYSIEKV